MKSSTHRQIACLTTAILILSGCGGSQSRASGGTALPDTAKQLQSLHHEHSWMLGAATSSDLIYATDGCGGTCVISYPSGQLVGSLPVGLGFSTSDCVDDAGNVYISNDTSVVEYAHGGTVPVATFNVPGDNARSCSFDSTTGNLAVIFASQQADVAVFPEGQGTPETYSSGLSASSCGYDNQGNLFVSGDNGQAPGLSELASGGSSFSEVTVSSKVGRPGRVQWDGEYLAYQGTTKGRARLTQLQITGSKAIIVKQVRLEGVSGNSYLSWISGGVAFLPYSTHGIHARKIGVWNYPSGGQKIQVFKHLTKAPNFQAVTLSLAN